MAKSRVKRGRHRRSATTGDPLSPSGRDPLAEYPDTQARRIILRFGGVQNLLNFMLRAGVRRSKMSIYHWLNSCGGIIPPHGVRDVFLAEIQANITLTDQDWSPYTVIEASGPAVVEKPKENPPASKEKVAPRRLVL